MRTKPGQHMKLSKPAELQLAAEYVIRRFKRSQRPRLLKRAAGIGKRARWIPELEQYVIGKFDRDLV